MGNLLEKNWIDSYIDSINTTGGEKKMEIKDDNAREVLHDIIIDLRKALLSDNDEIRADVSKQIDRLYEILSLG